MTNEITTTVATRVMCFSGRELEHEKIVRMHFNYHLICHVWPKT